MTERRDEIVRIAGDQFARKGFASTTVREIADEAGILSGSLYHHFDSKEAIAEEILADYYDGMADRFRKIVDEAATPLDALTELTRTAYRGIAEQPSAVALIDNSSDQLLNLPRFVHIVAMADELKQIWIRVIRKGIRQGYFRSSADARLVYTFIRDAMWVTARWWRPDGRYTIDEVADHFIDAMLYGVVDQAYRKPPRSSARPRASARKGTKAASTR
ncbi:MAG: TetR/AcrR family transcriptional regulator [Actinomycetia bacterium]|jgi:AcrR family transcriptional regulator|nr:TetR/AcrR family transcriptional regulator [Actinomycetes bacterium]